MDSTPSAVTVENWPPVFYTAPSPEYQAALGDTIYIFIVFAVLACFYFGFSMTKSMFKR